MPPPTRAARAAPASPSTSRRGPCSGSAGRRWPPGSAASGCWRAGHSSAPSPWRRARTRTDLIGIGAWLGTIMLLNVWGIIWPNQKKILGIVPATDEEKATRPQGRRLASRVELRAVDPDAHVHGFGRVTGCRSDANDAMPDAAPRSRDQVDGGARARTSAAATSPRSSCRPRSRCAAGSSRASRRSCAAAPGSQETFRQLDPAVRLTWHAADGERHHAPTR